MLVKAEKGFDNDVMQVICRTIDSYQGQECDVIIYTTVKLGRFVADEKRLNVAVTRAKFSLLVIGHRSRLCKNGLMRSFIESAASFNVLQATRKEEEAAAAPVCEIVTVAKSKRVTKAKRASASAKVVGDLAIQLGAMRVTGSIHPPVITGDTGTADAKASKGKEKKKKTGLRVKETTSSRLARRIAL